MFFNFVQKRRLFFIFSGVLILAGIIAMIISVSTYPERSIVRLGVDFTGGSLFEAQFRAVDGQAQTEITGDEVTAAFAGAGLEDIRVQRLGAVSTDGTATNRFQVKTEAVPENSETLGQIETALTTLATGKGQTFDTAFFTGNRQTVSAAIGSEVTRAALIATLVASLLVLGFIAIAFRNVKNSFRYGACAVIAMLHDILVMIGAMSIFGLLFGWEADSLFLTGLLTVVGYSVQDTIVVFDRIRENGERHRGENYETLVNRSIMETVQRSITTQICVAFVLTALFLMGSGAIRTFVGVLLVGLLSGAYSSICTAIPLLVAWEKGELPFVNRGAAKTRTATA